MLDLEGNTVASGKTDEKGELTFPNLRIGKYQLKETSTNKNYVLNEAIFEVEIEYNQITVKNITNDYKKGNIKIALRKDKPMLFQIFCFSILYFFLRYFISKKLAKRILKQMEE